MWKACDNWSDATLNVIDLELQGLKSIHPKKFTDERGFFLENYQRERYISASIQSEFVQDNFVYSKKNTIRGMHFQTFPGQDKLITVLKGEIYDVALDIRPNSKTFRQYKAMYLSDQNHVQFFIPHGFAHGYCVLSEEALVYYKVSEMYHADTEMGFRFDDPEIQIQWPVKDVIVSERDENAYYFKDLDFAKWFP